MKLGILIENDSDAGYEVRMIDVCINGHMIESSRSMDISGGKRVYDSINLRISELEKFNVNSIEKLEFSLEIYGPPDYYPPTGTGKFVVNF